MDDLRKLKILGARLNQIDSNINTGGCCVVAASVAKYLSKTTPVKIRVLSSYKSRTSTISGNRPKLGYHFGSEVCSWNDKGIHFGHIVLEFKMNGVTHYWDADTLTTQLKSPYCKWKMYKGALTVKEAWVLGNDEDGWNEGFDRANIPNIRSAISHFFRKSINIPYEKLLSNQSLLSSKLC